MGGRVVLFTEAYGVRSLGYCHLVVATMAVIMFGAMCRYNDASGLLWKNLRFVEDGSGFEIAFEKHKKTQYITAMRLSKGPEPAGRSKVVPAGARLCPPGTASVPPVAEEPLDEDEDVRTVEESAGVRPLVAGEDLPPDVVGVPPRAFLWS